MILTKIVIKNFRKKYGNLDSKLIPDSVWVKKYVNLKKVDFPDGSPTPNPANPSPAVYGPGEFSHDLNNPQSIVNVRNNMIHKISVLSLKKITCPSQGSLLIIKIQTGTRHFAKASLSQERQVGKKAQFGQCVTKRKKRHLGRNRFLA